MKEADYRLRLHQHPGWGWRKGSRERISLRVLCLVFIALCGAATAGQASGQVAFDPSEAFADSEAERYLRVLQQQGKIPSHPWSLRAFSPSELDLLWPGRVAHPWKERMASLDSNAGPRMSWISPRVAVAYNTGFPYGSHDGAVWMGKGFTTVAAGGVYVRAGPLSLTLAPVAFRAENRSFALAENGQDGPARFRNIRNPRGIDFPQRFGNGPYGGLDPGQSTLRLDALSLSAGVSTANDVWGPARDNPMMLGTNAAGFPRLFLGTGRPIDVWVGRIHGRLVGGWLAQSDFANMPADSSTRFASGFVGVFSPRGIDGLEIGASRFFHFNAEKSAHDFRHLTAPLGGFFGESTENASENQLATIFARWLFPGAGAEVYGEYLWEDYSWDFRGLMLNPDLNTAYMVGFAKSWADGREAITQLRAEVVNARTDPSSPSGFTTPVYTHSEMRQGHTQRGQLLGSPSAFGGTSTLLAVDRFYQGGRWTLEWSRQFAGEGSARDGSTRREVVDALHSLSADMLLLRGSFAVEAALGAVYEFNRNFAADEFNLHTSLGLRWHP